MEDNDVLEVSKIRIMTTVSRNLSFRADELADLRNPVDDAKVLRES